MVVRTHIDPIDRDVQLIIDEMLSPAARSKMFAADAQVMLDEADETNRQALGRVPLNHTYVDGHEGAPVTSVGEPGIIVREYDLVLDVLTYIGAQLRAISPVGKGPDRRPGHPGFYKASHVLYADGTEVPDGENIPDASEYVFLSDAPYARKVENRTTIYEMTAAKASRQYGNIAKVYFSWRAPLQPYVVGGSNRAERAALRNHRDKVISMHAERSNRVPAIIVTLGI
jgi:hypothetical protein